MAHPTPTTAPVQAQFLAAVAADLESYAVELADCARALGAASRLAAGMRRRAGPSSDCARAAAVTLRALTLHSATLSDEVRRSTDAAVNLRGS